MASRGWHFRGRERIGLIGGVCLVLAFGANLEQRTALRREPMTDLGVFSCASWTIWRGENLYNITDWHGWHYQYPPALAILFVPFEHPPPQPLPDVAPGEERTEANTPWGYGVPGHRFYGLHQQNARFFCIVAIWYFLSVAFCLLAAHAVACALERRKLGEGPPEELRERRRWWSLRLLPMLVCAGSIGTDLSRGQIDLLMLAALALGIYLAANHMDGPAGLIFSFPGSVKLMPPLWILYPLWSRKWRLAASMVGGLVFFLVVLPVAFCGPKRAVELYQTWVRVLVQPAMGAGTDKSRRGELTGMNSTDNQSLLAAIHNWRYHDLPRGKRPKDASAAARGTVYAAGALLLGLLLASSWRGRDERSPLHLTLCITGYIAVWLVASPVVHNYYYLLMLPLVTALLYESGAMEQGKRDWKLLGPVVAFMAVDLIARFPWIGGRLRDLGAPLLSLLVLLGAGIVLLARERRPLTRLEGSDWPWTKILW